MRMLRVSPQPRAQIWDGDSHTAETVPGVGHGYPSKCLPLLKNAPSALYTNIGVSGATGFHGGYDVNGGRRRVAVLLIGTNVYRVGGTSATVLSTYQSYMATLRGIGFHVVVTTCPPSSLISGANETARLTGNAALFGIGADGVIDLASDSVCGAVANYSNGVLGTDGTHALEAGCVQWARVAVPIINAVLAE